MGLLDSNKVALKTKVITISSKTVNNGYITEGLIDVSGYNCAILDIRGVSVSGEVLSYASARNAAPVLISNIRDFRYPNDAYSSKISASGNYVVDLSSVAFWGLSTEGSGTYNGTITLTYKTLDNNDEKSSVYTGQTDGTVKYVFNISDLGRKYKTAAIEVRLNDDTKTTSLKVLLRDSNNGLYFDNAIVRNAAGEISNYISKSGLYYVDISACDVFQLRNFEVNEGVGNVKVVFFKEEILSDLKPIQLVESAGMSMTGGESTIILEFAKFPNLYKYFKFAKFDIKYVGTEMPSFDIYVAKRISSNNYGAFIKMKSMADFVDVVDWSMFMGTPFVMKLQCTGTFVPAANDSLAVEFYGMR